MNHNKYMPKMETFEKRKISFDKESKTAVVEDRLSGYDRRRVFTKSGGTVFVEDFITDGMGDTKSAGKTEYLRDVDNITNTLANLENSNDKPSSRELETLPSEIRHIYDLREVVDTCIRIKQERKDIFDEILFLNGKSSNPSYYKEMYNLEFTIPEANEQIKNLKLELKNALETANKDSDPLVRSQYVIKIRDLRLQLATLEEISRILQQRLAIAQDKEKRIDRTETNRDINDVIHYVEEDIIDEAVSYVLYIIQERVKNRFLEIESISSIFNKIISMSKDFSGRDSTLLAEREISGFVKALIYRIETFRVLNFINHTTKISDFSPYLTDLKSKYGLIINRLSIGNNEVGNFQEILKLIKSDEELSKFFGGKEIIESSFNL